MRLSELLVAARVDGLPVGRDPHVGAEVVIDSRRCHPGCVFVALPGRRADGHEHAAAAAAAGAVAIVGERPEPEVAHGDAVYVRVPHARAAVGPLAHAAAGHPGRRLQLVAVTGTNGKTTTAFLIRSILEAAGLRTAVVGTERIGLSHARPDGAPTTTPEAPDLAALLREARERGVEAVVVEASSQGLEQHRLDGIAPDVAVLTHLSREHLEHHGTMDAYARAKSRLFGLTRPDGAAVASTEDAWAPAIAQAGGHDVRWYGRAPHARPRLLGVVVTASGTTIDVALPAQARWHTRLVGSLNAENAMAAAAATLALGAPPEAIGAGLGAVRPLPGRMEPLRLPSGGLALLDAAHSAHGLARALRDARRLAAPDGRVTCLFACVPNRDRFDRARLGAAARHGADRVVAGVLGGDEEAAQILADVRRGLGRADARREPDLARAAALALDGAQAGDVVLLAAHDVGVPRVGVPAPPDPLRAAVEARSARARSAA